MRTKKFKGKRIDNEEWVIGYGVIINTEHNLASIIHKQGINIMQHTEVIPETVGQFIELADRNGVEIYDGDICRVYIETGGISERISGYMYGVVKYIHNHYTIEPYKYDETLNSVFGENKIFGFLKYDFTNLNYIEVIGNIHTQQIK